MQVPLQIAVRDIPSTPVLEDNIRQKVQKLSQFSDRIIGCHVAIEQAQKHQHQGKLYNVRVDLKVPGEELPVTHNTHEDVYVALRDAFNDAQRLLKKYMSKLRGDGMVNHDKIPLRGTIARIFSDQGYGFIETETGDEIYFHHSVVRPSFEHLREGMDVNFLEEMGEKGPQASRVKVIRENGDD